MAMTGLVLNGIIGSGIFGVPPELIRLLGRASPLSMIVGALAIGTIVASVAEVASQFSEEGGAYLYVRTAFGRFAGLQVGESRLSPCANSFHEASLALRFFRTKMTLAKVLAQSGTSSTARMEHRG
ncbi:MAG TPA: amino acid permease [Candidatus Acidoferrales bacterium]|nr:amino acid permease [Candidatus Acidoferrales bacterium]